MKKIIIKAAIASVAIVATGCGQNPDRRLSEYLENDMDYDLVPVMGTLKNGHLYSGYANAQGERVIEWTTNAPRNLGPFHEGLALVSGIGFIDKDGTTAIELGEFDSSKSKGFAEGIALMSDGRETVGIDKSGEELFRVDGVPMSRMNAGYAIIEGNGNSSRYIIDSKGETVLEPDSDEYISYIRSAARPTSFLVQCNDGRAYFIDVKTNQKYLEDILDYSQCAVSPVIDWNDQVVLIENDLYGVMNLNGEWVIEPTYEYIRNDGQWYTVVEDGLVGWIGKDGKTQIKPQFEPNRFLYLYRDCFAFNGSDLAYIPTERCFINRKGERVYEDVPGDVESFNINGRYLLDKVGFFWMTLPDYELSDVLEGQHGGLFAILPNANRLR